MVEFIELSTFTKSIKGILRDEDVRTLQNEIMQEPSKGDLIPGGGGLRKLRFADSSRNKGKRGGLRVIYY
jgi:hypothetical protein